MNSAVCVLVVNKNNLEFLSVTLKNDHTDYNLPGGKVELEEVLKEKLGLPFSTETAEKIPELNTLMSLDTKISQLESTLSQVELKMPEGKSTREERFSF